MSVHSNNTDKQHSSELVEVIIQARGLIINLAGSPPAKKQSCWTRRWLNTSMVTFLETHIVNYSYFGTRYISRQLWGKNPQSEQPEYSITSINSWKFPNEHLQEGGEASLAIPSKNVSYSDHKIHELATHIIRSTRFFVFRCSTKKIQPPRHNQAHRKQYSRTPIANPPDNCDVDRPENNHNASQCTRYDRSDDRYCFPV